MRQDVPGGRTWIVTLDGEEGSRSDHAVRLGMSEGSLRAREDAGCTPEEACTYPKGTKTADILASRSGPEPEPEPDTEVGGWDHPASELSDAVIWSVYRERIEQVDAFPEEPWLVHLQRIFAKAPEDAREILYFLRPHDGRVDPRRPVKIGSTTSLKSRMATASTFVVDPVVVLFFVPITGKASKRESELHKALAGHRMDEAAGTEWFSFSDPEAWKVVVDFLEPEEREHGDRDYVLSFWKSRANGEAVGGVGHPLGRSDQ